MHMAEIASVGSTLRTASWFASAMSAIAASMVVR